VIKVTPLGEAEPRPRKIAIGTFDGVHVGHRAVIAGADTVLTFEPHPLEVLHPAAAPKLIMPFEVKRDVLDGLGVEEMVIIPFDESFTRITAEQFIEEILVGRLGATEVSVGENFRFGSKARGTPEMLAACDLFSTRVEPLVEVGGEAVSSTRIRALVAAGDMEQARRCLGVPFMIEGTVVTGDQRGRELGFPTANLDPARLEGFLPADGVYAAWATVDGVRYPSAVSIGNNPTFEGVPQHQAEAHLLDVDLDLYGRTIELAFVARLRGMERFDSLEALIAAIRADADDARRALSVAE